MSEHNPDEVLPEAGQAEDNKINGVILRTFDMNAAQLASELIVDAVDYVADALSGFSS